MSPASARNTTHMKNIPTYLLAFVALVSLTFMFTALRADRLKPLGSAQDGMYAVLQASATTSVGIYTPTKIFSAGDCKARVITTNNNLSILYGLNGLGTSTVAMTTGGHYQAASTTIVYDGGLFGCADWYALASATTTITTSSF